MKCHIRFHIAVDIVVFCDGQHGILGNSWEATLIECVDFDLETFVLANNFFGIFIGVERIHQHQWDIGFVCFVQCFDLLHGQIQKRQIASHWNHTFWTVTSHRCTQTTIQFDDHQFIQLSANLIRASFEREKTD